MPLLLGCRIIQTLSNLPRRFSHHLPRVRRRRGGAILARLVLDELCDVREDGVVSGSLDDFLARSRARARAFDVAVGAGEDAAVGDFVEAFVVFEEGFGC